MKYCTRCGYALTDDMAFCPQCGAGQSAPAAGGDTGLKTVAKVFMILSCIGSAFLLFPLAWTIPMTVHYCRAVNQHRPVGTAFKVCTLLFVDIIPGILMLCDNEPVTRN